MEAIIHPGMPKTGSSSIQATAVANVPEGWSFPDTKSGNMSGRFVLFFENHPHEHFSFKARGMSADEVQIERARHFLKFEKKLKKSAQKKQNILFSAERISNAPANAIKRMADLYRENGYKPRVVAYVRKPVSFMQSAFQQGIKVNIRHLNLNTMYWPRYRNRFEKFDEIFGRENVELSVFDKDALYDGDVCVDFFNKIGVDVPREKIVRVNESLSLAACALLFSQRNLGEGFVQGFKGAPLKNNAFVSTISRLRGQPLKFKRSLVEPLFEKWKSDLDWMENRLGQSLSDMPEEDMPDAIGSEEDLFAVADRNREALEELLIEEIQKEGDQPRDRLIRNLELLRKLHY